MPGFLVFLLALVLAALLGWLAYAVAKWLECPEWPARLIAVGVALLTLVGWGFGFGPWGRPAPW